MADIRTRFAPSPTGYLHLGSARTALYSWAYARRHGGACVLRIEDTDRARSTLESERALLSGLAWLGLDWDEGPVRQSEHGERHAEVVEQLLERGAAYRCSCSREELEERRSQTLAQGRSWVYDGRCRERNLSADCGPHTVRLRLDLDSHLGWDDLVYGESGQAACEIGDMNIRRSDGHPLYNLAVVVDDSDMRISHVIRGADHLGNTAFQIAIYRALELEPPRFAHVPLIVGASGKKLSKRRDPVSVEQFRDDGYLADALLNWLVRIGWSHGDQEVFSRDEICALFDLETVNRASAQADPGKLDWLNQHYLKQLPAGELLEQLLPFLTEVAGAEVKPTPELAALAQLLCERSSTLRDMAGRAAFAVVETPERDSKAEKKFLKPTALPILEALVQRLRRVDPWDEAQLEAAFEDVRAQQRLARDLRDAPRTGLRAQPGAHLGRRRPHPPRLRVTRALPESWRALRPPASGEWLVSLRAPRLASIGLASLQPRGQPARLR
ncbi:MAG: glutamate--tRNA ligase [Deltaproteobacteria bacterium]|nr:glutamate--tRNA ligase [Deltaproteobacteria bacterium]